MVACFWHVELAIANIHELRFNVLTFLRAVFAEAQKPLEVSIVLLDKSRIVVSDKDITLRVDSDPFRLVEVRIVVAFATKAADELASGLVKYLNPGMRRISDQQVPVLRKREVLDIFELAV